MEPFISNDTFDAFRTNDGIEIREKKAAAKKISVIVIIVGIVFLGIGMIPMEGLTYEWITTMFSAVFFYGGILMCALGILVLAIRGTGSKEGPVTVLNKNTQIMYLRNKEIPFAEIESFAAQTTEVMNRKMTAMLFTQNGKKKGFIGGTVISEDVESLERFVQEINALIAKENSESEH